MTEPSPAPASPERNRATLAIFAVAFAAIAAVLYVKAGTPGKKAESAADRAACAASAKIAAAAEPLARGEVAAMAIARQPEPMQDVSFNGPDGKPVTLAAFKGRTILLNLWATWCVPCRSEMPALDRLQQAAGSDRFEVVAVNVDTSRLDRPKALLDEIGARTLRFYSDPKADIFFQMRQNGKVLGLPTTFLIDPAGCQIGLLSGPAAWDSAEAKALVAAAVSAAAP